MKAIYVLLFASLLVAVSMVQAQRRMLQQGTSGDVAQPAPTGVSTSGKQTETCWLVLYYSAKCSLKP